MALLAIVQFLRFLGCFGGLRIDTDVIDVSASRRVAAADTDREKFSFFFLNRLSDVPTFTASFALCLAAGAAAKTGNLLPARLRAALPPGR